MGNTSYYSSSSVAEYDACISNSSNDTIVHIGILVGIVIGSLAGISIIISVILVTCIIMKKFNSSSIKYSSLQTSCSSFNNNSYQSI